MKFPRQLLFAIAALSLIGSSLGCYTLLKHPRVQIDDRPPAYYEEDERVSFADDCASCHSPGSLQSHHPAVPPPRRTVSPTWDYYYAYPWWIPYYASGNNPEEAAEKEQKKRPFDRRHLSTPDENVAPSQASTPAPSTAPTPAIAKPANANEGNSTTPPKSEDTNKREEKRSGEDKSDERRTRKPKTE
jgi:hypothetical protein